MVRSRSKGHNKVMVAKRFTVWLVLCASASALLAALPHVAQAFGA